jgi:hypothetical protein
MTKSRKPRAEEIVNPSSGLANDYLNHFNEILLLIENFPSLLPEMFDEILAWQPVGYKDYFMRSPLPGNMRALAIYDGLDPEFRRDFKSMVERLDAIVLHSISIVAALKKADGTLEPDSIRGICEWLGHDIRVVLDRLVDLVNHGHAPALERPQEMADRLLSADRLGN